MKYVEIQIQIMQVEAHFEHIQEVLLKELNQAEKSIFVAVAWFTDRKLLNCLIQQAAKSIKVNLLYLDDEINRNRLDFSHLSAQSNSNVYAYPYNDGDQLMHHKFCVIDNQIIITGSYNWSNKAKTNEENITITKEAPLIAGQFVQRFKKIVEQFCGVKFNDNESDSKHINKLYKRLQLIKNFILLEEFDDLQVQAKKIQLYINHPQIKTIILAISNKEYAKAITKIDFLTAQLKQLTSYEDSEIFALRLEIKVLELEITAISNEKSEVEKLIYDFGVMQNRYLGELIKNILKFRKEKLEKERNENKGSNKTYEDAKQDYEKYNNQFEELRDSIFHKLTKKEQKEIKHSFRKASLLCHPDKVSELMKEQAEHIFIELQTAYSQNDIERVNEILMSLETNIPFVSRSEKYTEKATLKAEMQRLRLKINEYQKELKAIKNTDSFQLIKNIGDWKRYFIEAQYSLRKELNRIKEHD